MTPDLARIALVIIGRGAPFTPMTAAEAPLFMQTLQALELLANTPPDTAPEPEKTSC